MSSADEPYEPPLGKLPYERHRRPEPPPSPEEQHILALDPLRWKPIKLGLGFVFWGYAVALVVVALFTLLFLYNVVASKIDIDVIREIAIGAGGLCALAVLLVIVGESFCVTVPKVARGRVFIIVSVCALIVAVVSLGVFVGTWEAPEPVPAKAPEAQPPAVPPTPAPANAEPNAPPVVIKNGPLWPGLTVPKSVAYLILVAYLVAHFFFILFLKRVALFYHNEFLADNMGGYLVLFLFHTVLVALLPATAMIACFFWVVMLGLKCVLAIWLLRMLAATRRAIG